MRILRAFMLWLITPRRRPVRHTFKFNYDLNLEWAECSCGEMVISGQTRGHLYGPMLMHLHGRGVVDIQW